MNLYLIGGVALIIAIMGWQLKSSITRNGELEAKLDTQVTETLECTAANATTMTTISELTTEIETIIEERRVDTERREQVLAEREADFLRARAENDRLRDERENEQDESADCKDLASLRVDFFCPDTAGQLRERSAGPGGNRDTDG